MLKMKKLKLTIFLLEALLLSNLVAQAQTQLTQRTLTQRTLTQQSPSQQNQNQSVVYFTKDVSSAGLLKVYNALSQKITGNVGIKVSFGSPNEQVLDAKLLTDLVQKTNGTMFDGNGFQEIVGLLQ